MIVRSIVGKLWVTVVAFTVVVLIVFSSLLSQFVSGFLLNKELDDLVILARSAAQVLLSAADREQSRTLTELRSVIEETKDRRLYLVFGPDAAELPQGLRPIAASAEFRPVWSGGSVKLRTTYEEGGKRIPVLVVASGAAVPAGKGAVLILEPEASFRPIVEGIDRLILGTIVLSALGVTAWALFLTRRITQPLTDISLAAKRIAEGEYDTHLAYDFQDEIGLLARSFNQMASRLRESINALREKGEELEGVLESMEEGVFLTDTEGTFLHANSAARRLVPSLEEFFSLIRPQWEEAIREGKTVRLAELEFLGRSYHVTLTPLYREEGGVRGVSVVFRDITLEVRLETLRRDFFANVSHELKTPVALMQGYTEALLDGLARNEEEERELIQIIHEETLRMGRLVQDLLDFSRLEAGRLKLYRRPTMPEELVTRLKRRFDPILRERGIRFRTAVETKGSYCLDPDRFEQILTNLVDNALRYTPYGGEIAVRAWEDEEVLWFEVSDTGVGIEPEDLPYVFERFYKGDKSRRRGEGGSGLGLAIVKRLVEAHGGTIWVESTLGKGTTFRMRFPLGELRSCDEEDV
ncbi:HAMP domain-containing sensor histidine kinase [Brockia lithotrophica]|uniref:histidine kinase n=1 Tax=Brockia lithotrophica TaxID=933949 RepID=A0A660L9R6_9BACL|nr:HAMP domain-containing sensor histidine kinase [Brockia lithotrophica]RKQ88683.1 PAS/PAC sensor signal transduction histidine kinase [Brockia lithotrophica]